MRFTRDFHLGDREFTRTSPQNQKRVWARVLKKSPTRTGKEIPSDFVVERNLNYQSPVCEVEFIGKRQIRKTHSDFTMDEFSKKPLRFFCMPKKEKSKETFEEKEDEKTHEESELEEEIKEDELGEIAKKISEEDLEIKSIDKNQFRESLQADSSSPVLEEIAGEQELSAVFFTSGKEGGNEEENTENYSLEKYEKSGESKYDEPPRSFHEEVSTGTPPDVGLARNLEIRQQDFTISTPEAQRMQRDVTHDSESDYLQPERFEQKNQAMPFEKEDKKYKEFKP